MCFIKTTVLEKPRVGGAMRVSATLPQIASSHLSLGTYPPRPLTGAAPTPFYKISRNEPNPRQQAWMLPQQRAFSMIGSDRGAWGCCIHVAAPLPPEPRHRSAPDRHRPVLATRPQFSMTLLWGAMPAYQRGTMSPARDPIGRVSTLEPGTLSVIVRRSTAGESAPGTCGATAARGLPLPGQAAPRWL